MAINTSIIVSMSGDELLEFFGRFRQVFDVESNVFNQTSCSRLTCSAYRREDARTNGPILGIFFRSVCEMYRYVAFERSQTGFYRSDVLIELHLRTRHGLGKDSGQTGSLLASYLFFVCQVNWVVDRRQALVIQEFRSLHHCFTIHIHQLLHRHHSPTSFLDGFEIEHRTGLVWIVILCIHGHLRKERQGSFRAYHEVSNNIKRIVKLNKRQKIETSYILDGIFVTDAFSQLLIGTDSIPQFSDATDKIGMGRLERSPTNRVARIEHRSVHQDDTGRNHHLVAVGVSSAIHAGSIVHHNTADHSTFHTRRVGCKLTPIRSQNFIHPLSDNARLERNLLIIIRKTVVFPMLAGHNQNRVTNGLS